MSELVDRDEICEGPKERSIRANGREVASVRVVLAAEDCRWFVLVQSPRKMTIDAMRFQVVKDDDSDRLSRWG